MSEPERLSEMPDRVFSSVEEATENFRYRVFMHHLCEAHEHARKAMDALYGPDRIKRNVWQRMMLGRAQSMLISMYVKEMKRKDWRN